METLVKDFKKSNTVTREDKHPLPNMDGILDKLGRANYFTVLDLAKGFYQIEMDPKDIEKTAFSTSHGHYEYLRMPLDKIFTKLKESNLKVQLDKTEFLVKETKFLGHIGPNA